MTILKAFIAVLGFIILFASYLIRWVKSRDAARKARLEEFLKSARSYFVFDEVAEKLKETHMELRESLYTKYGDPSKSLADYDEEMQHSEDYANSWQRKLPDEESEQLRKIVIRRLVKAIPSFQARRLNYHVKNILYSKNLLAQYHMQSIETEFHDACEQFQLLIFEANCLEDSPPDGPHRILRLASVLVKKTLEDEQKQKRMANTAQSSLPKSS